MAVVGIFWGGVGVCGQCTQGIETVAGVVALGDGGAATAASLYYPEGVAVDAAGNLYIADTANHRIRKVSPTGVITTVAGNGTYGYSGDGGPATAASLNWPSGVALDAAGNLYIADTFNHRIRKVSPTGVITTVAGNGTYGYSGDGGAATAASFNRPSGVAVDAAGNLYIADPFNHRIRKVRLVCQPEPAVTFRDATSGISVVNGSGNLFALGGLFAGDPGSAVEAGGRLVVAARDTYSSLWVSVADPRTGVSSGWQYVGGLIQGTPGVGVVQTGSGQVAQVVVRDQWNSYWAVGYEVSTGVVQGWQYLAGVFTTDPAVAACADGTVYVVGRDNWGSLWSRRWIPAVGWEPWVWGMGVTQGKPAVACGRNQVVPVAVRDNWNTLWLERVSGNVWQGWQWAGGVMDGDPEIASLGNGWVEVTLRDGWGGVWRRRYDEDSQSWGNWVFTNGVLTRQAPAAAGGALHVLGTDAVNTLWHYAAGLGQWTLLGHANTVNGPLAGAPR
jgi:sugar lactone lactonase YvrE